MATYCLGKTENVIYMKYKFNYGAKIPDKIKFDILTFIIMQEPLNIEKIIPKLLSYGVNINTKILDEYACEQSVLTYAVINKNMKLVKCLLNNGADYNIADVFWCTPLHWAAGLLNKEAIFILMSKYDDIGKMTFSNLNYLKKKLPTLHLSYNAHWPPFYIVLRYDADMASEMLKFTINLNKDLEKVKDLFKNSSHQEKGSDKFVNTFGTLFNMENISKNVKDFLNNIYTICAYPEAYMLHSYVIF